MASSIKNWGVILGGGLLFSSSIFLFGEFVFSLLLPVDHSNYLLLKFIFLLLVNSIIFLAIAFFLRKNILLPLHRLVNKLRRSFNMEENLCGLICDWRYLLLNFSNAIENGTLMYADTKRELKEIRSKYDSILDTQSELVFRVDELGYMTYCNKALSSFMQLENLDEAFIENDFANDAKIAMILNSCDKAPLKEARKTPKGYQFIGVLEEGGACQHIDWIIKYIPSKKDKELGGSYLLVGRDVTVEHDINEKNHRLENLASIGRLAYTISHEINQPLTTMKLASSNLESLFKPCSSCVHSSSEKIVEKSSKITKQIVRIEKIIKNLKNFSRGQSAPKPFDFESAVINVAMDNAELYGIKHINIDLQLTNKPVIINGSEVLFQQAVYNIIDNAIYAIENNNVATPTVTIKSEVNVEEKVVLLHITDNGGGCSDDALKKLTTPFFTTKPAGDGSGIGLALCFSIIKKMMGELKYRNIQNGFEVILTIPCTFGEGFGHTK